jgi:hypothetical protein
MQNKNPSKAGIGERLIIVSRFPEFMESIMGLYPQSKGLNDCDYRSEVLCFHALSDVMESILQICGMLSHYQEEIPENGIQQIRQSGIDKETGVAGGWQILLGALE